MLDLWFAYHLDDLLCVTVIVWSAIMVYRRRAIFDIFRSEVR